MATAGGLLASLSVVGLFILYVWSLIWSAADARRRDKPAWLGVAIVGVLAWPIGLVAWLAFRPAATGRSDATAVSNAWKPMLGLTGLCLLGLAAGYVPTAFGVLTDFRQTKAYADAVQRIYADPQVVERLGEPIHASRLVSGSYDEFRSSGAARLSIPIRGRNRNAVLHLEAGKRSGEWYLEEAALDIGGESVDLMAMRLPEPGTSKPRGEIDWLQGPSDLAPALPVR